MPADQRRNPPAPGPRAGRPVSAPAYYLARPASVWITATRRRRVVPVPDPDAASGPVRISRLPDRPAA